MGVEQGKPYIVPLTALLGSLCSISRMFLIHAPIIWNLDTEPSFTLTTKIKRPSASKTAAFSGMILSLYIRSHVVAAAVIISSRAQPASGEFWHIGGLLPKNINLVLCLCLEKRTKSLRALCKFNAALYLWVFRHSKVSFFPSGGTTNATVYYQHFWRRMRRNY